MDIFVGILILVFLIGLPLSLYKNFLYYKELKKEKENFSNQNVLLQSQLNSYRLSNFDINQKYDKIQTDYKYCYKSYEESQKHLSQLNSNLNELKNRFSHISNLDDEKQKILNSISELNKVYKEACVSNKLLFQKIEEYKNTGLLTADSIKGKILKDIELLVDEKQKISNDCLDLNLKLEDYKSQINSYKLEEDLVNFGIYNNKYNFNSAALYENKLNEIIENQKSLIKKGKAAICSTQWKIGGSYEEGKKQTEQTFKLMLRAFCGESDIAISKVKYNNIQTMEKRIQKTFETINELVITHKCSITQEFLNFKLQELYLMHEYQEKLQKEKDEQKAIKEQMREEEKARVEIEKAQQEAEKEEKRFAEALNKAKQSLEAVHGEKQKLSKQAEQKLSDQIAELERKLLDAQNANKKATSQAQLTKAGHVYIISNIGSFGENVFKIGMTRRLDPMDRVYELGDASVPFDFDVHAMIYSTNAPELENKLHKIFYEKRLNKINDRKEFFKVGIQEIVDAVQSIQGDIRVTLTAEAEEYRKTLAMENK